MDLPSDSDQSDEDFCPQKEMLESLSEDESEEEGMKDSFENVNKKKTNKNRNKKRQHPEISVKKNNENDKCVESTSDNEDVEKKKADALWASFLGETVESSNSDSTSNSVKNKKKNDEKIEVTNICDFAGEEVKITKQISVSTTKEEKQKNPIDKTSEMNKRITSKPTLKRNSGGLTAILGQIGKKSKLTVLEKTKIDWDGFKKKEDITEELKCFNKGRDGYLERKDFLQRTDVRQFEIERKIRQTSRRNR